jgi:hypothetical protein
MNCIGEVVAHIAAELSCNDIHMQHHCHVMVGATMSEADSFLQPLVFTYFLLPEGDRL